MLAIGTVPNTPVRVAPAEGGSNRASSAITPLSVLETTLAEETNPVLAPSPFTPINPRCGTVESGPQHPVVEASATPGLRVGVDELPFSGDEDGVGVVSDEAIPVAPSSSSSSRPTISHRQSPRFPSILLPFP